MSNVSMINGHIDKHEEKNPERDRLIELIKDGHSQYIRKISGKTMYEEIADYLIENGVIVPPCKVGQTMYCIVEGFDKVMEGHIRQFIVAKGIFIDCVIRGYFNQVFHSSQIGKTVFLTKEEAEEALSKLQASCKQVKGEEI